MSTNHQTKFLANVLSYGRAGIVGRIFRAIQELSIRMFLPPSVLGAWSLVTVLVNFSTISELGIFSAARRELPVFYSNHQYKEAAEFRSMTFSMHFLAKVLMGVFVIAYCIFNFGWQESYLETSISAVFLIILAAFGENYSCFFETAQKYQNLGRALSIYWPACAFLMIGGAYFGGVYGLVIANAFALILQGWLMRSAMVEKIPAQYFYWNSALAKKILTFAVPFFISDFPINLMYTFDSLFVAKYFSQTILAVYTTGKMLALQAGQIPMWITNVLEIRLTFLSFQTFTSVAQIRNETLHYMVAYLLIFMPLITISLFMGCWYVLENFIPAYRDVCRFLPMLLASLYLMPKTTPLRNFLLIQKNFKVLACINYASLIAMLICFYPIWVSKEPDLFQVACAYLGGFLIYSTLILFSLSRSTLGMKYASLIMALQWVSLLITLYAVYDGYQFITGMHTPMMVDVFWVGARMISIILPIVASGTLFLYWNRHNELLQNH